MAQVPWTFLIVFVALPFVLVLADILYLAKEVWTVPWLALVAMVWFGVGITVALGAVEEPREA